GTHRARRHLRPGAGRRPTAVPAHVLVLLAPRRVHHVPAGDGRGQRDHSVFRATPDLWLQVHGVRAGRHLGDRFSCLGPPHVRGRHVGHRDAGVLDPVFHHRGAVGDQGVQLDRDAEARPDQLRGADAVRAGLRRPVHDRRHERADVGRARARHPVARDVLRDRALPLRDGGGHRDGVPRRHPLLVAEDHRTDVLGRLGALRRDPDVLRFQLHVLPAIRARLPRHAASLPRVSTRVPDAQHPVVGGRVDPGTFLSDSGGLSRLVAVPWHARGQQSVGRARARVADHFAATQGQFPRAAGGAEGLRLRRARPGRRTRIGSDGVNSSTADLRARGLIAEQFDDAGQQHATAQFGMWLFLTTEVLFFGVLFTGYAVCRARDPQAFLLGSRHTEIIFGAIEAGILLLSSATVTFAVNLVKFDERRMVTALLAITALLGVTFLVLHGVEYSHEYDEHLMIGVDFAQHGPHARGIELFFFLYYAMTLYHSLHVLIGVCVLATMGALVWRRKIRSEYTTPLLLAGLYWHLVDIVWIFLFPLMYLIGR